MAHNLYRPNTLQPNINNVRVVLVHRDFTGTGVSHIGLGITSSYTAKTLRKHGIWATAWSVPTHQVLAERLRRTNQEAAANGEVRVSHVILSAPWIPTNVIQQLASEFSETVFVVVSHSNVGFLSADPQAIRILRETSNLQMQAHNVFVGGNASKFTDWATEAWGVNVVWLPNLYSTDEDFPIESRWVPGTPVRLGLFGANRPLKNWTTAAGAVVELVTKRLKVPTTLLCSSGRTEGGNWRSFHEMLDNVPNLTVQLTGWLTWPLFRQVLRTCHLMLQPTFTESFSVVTADAVAEGVPVAASEAIDWVPKHWQAESDNPSELARVAEMLLHTPSAKREGREALAAYVKAGVMAWREFLAAPRTELEAWRRFSDGE